MDTSKTETLIKEQMPKVYAAIHARAKQCGKDAFVCVRRGLRGEANCFYAIEGGYVVGTPFDQSELTDAVARLVVAFGVGHMVMWPPMGESNGTN